MRLLLITFLICNFCIAQKDLLLDKTLKKNSIKAEFAELYNLTNTIHPGQFMFCSKADFDKTYLDLKTQ